jgi:predicted acyl esterase
MIYNPTEKHWDSFAQWPGVPQSGLTPFYLQTGNGLGTQQASGADSYVSDPAKPVPFEPLPARFADHPSWAAWLVQDQRFVSTRPDVLSYQTPVLDHEVRLEGAPFADLFARTTGSDVDFVVKIIDVYPPPMPNSRSWAAINCRSASTSSGAVIAVASTSQRRCQRARCRSTSSACPR